MLLEYRQCSGYEELRLYVQPVTNSPAQRAQTRIPRAHNAQLSTLKTIPNPIDAIILDPSP